MEERLAKFARLVDAGSFTKAATLMHISQPALTTALKKLERELGAELLIRSSRTFKLTVAGEMAYDAAKDLLSRTRNLKQQIHEHANRRVTLHLGMIDSIADLLFVHSEALTTLKRQTQLSLAIDNSTRLMQQVEHDEIDLALIAQPSMIPSSLTQHMLAKEPLILVTHSDNAATVKRDIRSKHINNFLGYNQHSQTYRLIEMHLQAKGIVIKPTFYSTNPDITLELVLSGEGTAVLPYLLTRELIEDGQLVALNVGGSAIINRTIISLHRSGRERSLQAEAVLIQAKSALQELSKETRNL